MTELNEVGTLSKPDFINHPHLYFHEGEARKLTEQREREKEDVSLLDGKTQTTFNQSYSLFIKKLTILNHCKV